MVKRTRSPGNSSVGCCRAGSNSTSAFADTVKRFAGNDRVYGWYLSDEPNPDQCPGIAGELRRRADIVHRYAPGQKAFASLTDWPMAPLKPSETHLDLIGAFKPSMRETDDEAVRRARIFVDTRAGALAEGGDLIQPIRAGIITQSDIAAELAELAAGAHPGRQDDGDITLFKSVGASLEDLAGAILALEQVGRKASEEV